MFQSVLGPIQASVQNTVDIIVNRALIGLFFFVAAGLATAAAGLRLANEYGLEVSLAVLTTLFVVAGLIAASVLKVSDTDPELSQPADAAAAEVEGNASSGAGSGAGLASLTNADRELILGLLASVAPLVAPRVIGLVVRNIPAMLVIAIVLFVLVRQAGTSEVQSVGTPAEAVVE